MIKCPNCGSSAQVKVIKVEFKEDSRGPIRYITYECGCGHIFHHSHMSQREFKRNN